MPWSTGLLSVKRTLADRWPMASGTLRPGRKTERDLSVVPFRHCLPEHRKDMGSLACATLKRSKAKAVCETLNTLPGASTTFSDTALRASVAESCPSGKRHQR